MFEIYLLNLYKNLDFYNIKNIDKYNNFYKNKIHNMIGGVNNVDLDAIKDLSTKIKEDMERFKQKMTTSNTDSEFISVKKDKFKLMTDIIEYTTKEIMRDHELVKQDIDKMYDTTQSNKFKQIQQTIDEINNMFSDLLS
jgi:hypothetical protein